MMFLRVQKVLKNMKISSQKDITGPSKEKFKSDYEGTYDIYDFKDN